MPVTLEAALKIANSVRGGRTTPSLSQAVVATNAARINRCEIFIAIMLPVECRYVFITSALGFIRRRLTVLFGICLLTACQAESGGGGVSTESSPDDSNRRGELLSLACQACHSLAEGQPHQVGPNLHGLIGRRAGQVPGFNYSPALEGSSIVWSEAALDRWLADPIGYLPGTTMVFTGYQQAEDRAALIAFLVDATSR